MYTPNPKLKEYNIIVPKPDQRQDIITRAHQLGHFKEETTYKQLQNKFFWKNMRKDIAFVISQCLPCVRNKILPTISNPSIALKVTDIFDRIGIDLVFGLPLTDSGYHGVLIITEYLTKYPYVVPIKSKEAKEISQHFLQYMSIFGPPKQSLFSFFLIFTINWYHTQSN